MGLDLSIEIFNQSHTPVVDVFSVSGDVNVINKSQFQRREEYTQPVIDANSRQKFKTALKTVNPIVYLLMLNSKFTAPLGLSVVQAIIRAIEKPLELTIQYEDGSVDDISFSVRPINVRKETYESVDTVANLFNLDFGNLLKCLLMGPVLAQTAGSAIDFAFKDESKLARDIDQDCRVCLMRLDKDRLDHTWTVISYASDSLVRMTFEHTKSNLSHELIQELTTKAKLRMQKKRFMECVQQLLSALATTLSEYLKESTVAMIKAAVHKSASDELELAINEQKGNEKEITNNHHFLQAIKGFEAAKILAITKEEKHQLDQVIKGIKLKNEGDEFFRQAYKAETEGNELTNAAINVNDASKHMQAADQANKIKNLYLQAANCYKQVIKQDARLGYLEPIAIRNFEKQAERARDHEGRAGLCCTPDLVANLRAYALSWQGKTLLEIKGQVKKYDRIISSGKTN